MIAILLPFGAFLAVFVSQTASEALLSETKNRGISTAVHVAKRVSDPMLAMDFLRMKDLLDEVVRTGGDTAYVFILDTDGRPVVHTFSGGFPTDLLTVNRVGDQEPHHIQLLTTGSELIYDFAVPVLIDTYRLGTVRLGLSQKELEREVDQLLWAILLVVSIAIVIAAVTGTTLARTVTKRVRLLHHSAEEIVKGNLDVQSSPDPKAYCWQIMDCPHKECPAYGKTRHRCWYIAGTMCPTCVEGEYAKKIDMCQNCPVYRSQAGDEIQSLAEYFDLMALTLRNRLEDLKRTQLDLHQQQQVFRTILDVTPDLVCLKDEMLRYQAVNKAFCSFFETEESSILGRHEAVLPPQEAERDRQEDLKVLGTGIPIQTEKKYNGAQGERWFHEVKTPVHDMEGRIVGLLCNARDITQLRELQMRMVESQKLESLGQLAAGVAHEINTPLGIILGYVQLLLEDFPEESEEHETLRIVEKHTRICKKIVADLLRFSRHTESHKKPLSVNKLLDQIINIVEHTFGLEHIEIERSFKPDLPLIFGDQEKLQQVFLNLLNNAYDAIGSNGKVTVSTDHDKETDEVTIAIEDTGTGIPKAIQSKIFDPFFTTKDIGKGTGLGLSVTFGIVKDHGGKITVKSPVAQATAEAPMSEDARRAGTAFTLRFPAYREPQ